LKELIRERWTLLVTLKNTLTPFMDILAFVWLGLTLLELTSGLSSLLQNLVTIIWIIFALYFLIEFILAPQKKVYLSHNWLTGISLFLPALRIFRFLRVFRYLRGLRSLSLLKIMSSVNRGMRSLGRSVVSRVSLYVLCLTAMVIFSGAAGILNLEGSKSDYISSFGSALWWSAMMVTTIGTDYFPQSPEGRILAFGLAVYGFAVFGYVAASLASYLMGKVKKESQNLSTEEEIKNLRKEIKELRDIVLKRLPNV
jgi:voltage-gated potassium channel